MLFSLVIILSLGFLFGILAKKIHIPHILGYILAGIVLGPSVLNKLDGYLLIQSGLIKQFILMLILTIAGFSIDLEGLKSNKFTVVGLSIIPGLMGIISALFFGHIWLGLDIIQSAIIGVVIGGIAPAIILPRMMNIIEEGYDKKQIPQIITTSITNNDVLLLFVFSILIYLASNNYSSAFLYVGLIPISIITEIIIAIFVSKGLYKLSSKLNNKSYILNLIFLTLFVIFVFIEKAISGIVPFSAMIFVLSMALSLRYFSKDIAEDLKVTYKKIWPFGEILLFTLLGAGISLDIMKNINIFHFVTMFTVQIFITIGVLLTLIFKGYKIKNLIFYVLAYSPKATMQAAIGGIPFALGIAGGEDIFIVSILCILFFAPLGSILLDKYSIKLLSD